MNQRICPALLSLAVFFTSLTAFAQDKVIRIGIIGCDTSHVPAFTKEFNDPKAAGDLAGFKVVAAFPGGSPDVESSRTRIDKFVEGLRKVDVEIVDSIPKLLEKVDVVLLESVDGRPHLEQARPVIAAKKPVFIDKPMAGSLADAIAIMELARRNGTPVFSSSSLRYASAVAGVRADPKLGEVKGCVTWGPSPLEEHHPDLFWYGVHGVEMLYAVMGPGCQSVSRVNTKGADVVTGEWSDGRLGTFRGIRDGKAGYGLVAIGSAGTVVPSFEKVNYGALTEQIAKFFKGGKPPVAIEETVESLAFMEAADESKRQGGKSVKIADVMAKASEEAKAKIAR